MDRPIVYDGALPQATDILNLGKFGMVGQAYQNRAILGTSTVVAGLACLPTSPTADLHVSVGVGSIYQMDPTDAAAYGDLGVDNNSIVKQGILATAQTLTITPPATTGFSQVYLVQAALNDIDGGATVLSYYNSSNPASPYSGPSNSGSSNFTTRTCTCAIALKAGIPATTGTQVSPSADAGYVGLYAITVANGATQITSGNITQLATAPFIPLLPQVPTNVQSGTWVYCLDTGAANAYVVNPSPNIASGTIAAGFGIRMKVLTTNTTNSTLAVNYTNASGVVTAVAGSPFTIHRGSTAGVAAADLTSGAIVDLVYDGTYFQMANYLGSGTNTNTSTVVGIPYIADSGAQNAVVATFSPAFTGYGSGLVQIVAGTTIAVKLANFITGACTIVINGLASKNITLGDLTSPPYNAFVAGMVLVMEYDGTQWQIINTSAGMFYRQPTSNYNYYVNVATGSDTLYDGTSATVSGSRGPFKTIQKGLNVCWSWAPSLFSTTLNIAAGTYPETIQSQNWSTSTVNIIGAGMGSTIISSPASFSSGIPALTLGGNTIATLQSLTIQGGGIGLSVQSGMNCTITNVAFAGNWTNEWAMQAASAATLQIQSFTLSGNTNSVIVATVAGNVNFLPSSVVTISTPVSVAAGFCNSFVGAIISANVGAVPTFVNPSNVTGAKYFASINGVIYAPGSGVNLFPGTIAGSTSLGGIYVP